MNNRSNSINLLLEGNLEKEIIQLIKDNPNPEDEVIHAFAEKKRMNPHKMEGQVYKLFTRLINKNPDFAPGNDTCQTILDFFKENPNPKDEAVHQLAEKLGIKPDDVEERIYKMITKLLGVITETKEVITEESNITNELIMGKEVEKEHTGTLTKIIKLLNPDITDTALEKLLQFAYLSIANDHLKEIKDYYTRLKKMEDEAKKGNSNG